MKKLDLEIVDQPDGLGGIETVVLYVGQRVGTWHRDNLADEARRKLTELINKEAQQ